MSEATNNPQTQPPAPGGATTSLAEATRFSENIDLSKPEDVAAARQLLLRSGKRWPILPGERARLVQCLNESAKHEGKSGDVARKLLSEMERVNQRDEERADDKDRADKGKAPVGGTTVFVVRPPRVIGEPAD